MRITRIMFILLIGALLTVVACAPPPTPTATPTPAPTVLGANEVWITSRSFTPASITVPVGTTVTWINKDREESHIVTRATGLFNESVPVGGSFSYTFTERGTFEYDREIYVLTDGAYAQRTVVSGAVVVK